MITTQALPRDAFIDEIYSAALKNKDIYFFSADLGAMALDRFRVEANGQFVHAGISEQNMIDIAAGMALNGKTVYVYAMAPFVTLRCYEQIKVALASMNLPVTIIGVGVGYGYDDAGPTHYATEDISCMRALAGIEVLTPCDTQSVIETARLSYTNPHLRYIRLDRKYLPQVYLEGDIRFINDGIVEIEKGQGVCVMTAGYMVHKAKAVKTMLAASGIDLGIIDVFKLKPISRYVLASVLEPYQKIVTVEEHFLSGGLGGAVIEALVDYGIHKDLMRLGIRDDYHFNNGGREYLHKLCKIDVGSMAERIKTFC